MKNEDIFDIKAESSWLHPSTTSKEKLKQWVLTKLGYPQISVELTDAQLDSCIADAIEKWSKYASFPRDQFIVESKDYEHGKGINLMKYNVACVNDISFENSALGQLFGYGDQFFGMPAYMQYGGAQGMFPFFNNGRSMGLGWTSLHMLHENLSMIQRLTGSAPQFTYYKSTGYLKIIPEPHPEKCYRILIDAEMEPPFEEMYGNEYVKRLTLAYSKILLGTIRKKFQNVQLLGGGQVDTEIGNEGKEELDKLMEQIRNDESFSGSLFHIN